MKGDLQSSMLTEYSALQSTILGNVGGTIMNVHPNLDLNVGRLERRMWRMQQQDGLLDLLLGVAILALGLAAMVEGLGGGTAARLATLCGIQFSAAFAMGWARRRWTRPLIGSVKFAPHRRRRLFWMQWILGGSVVATAALVMLTMWANRIRPGMLGGLGVWAPALTSAAVIMVPLGAMAIIFDVTRLWLHAILLSAAVVSSVSVAVPPIPFFETVLFGVAGLFSCAVGLTVLMRFLQAVRQTGESPGPQDAERLEEGIDR